MTRLEPATATILVVEDHEINQRVAVKMLEKGGYTVLLASNGEEALARIEAERPDLVLMDLHMPLMDGLEATARIRAGERANGSTPVPIIAITANAMRGDRERCLAAGMDGYIAKPVDSRCLLAEVRRVLGGQTTPAVSPLPPRPHP